MQEVEKKSNKIIFQFHEESLEHRGLWENVFICSDSCKLARYNENNATV